MVKSDRELRSGTRKDYAKLADVDSDTDNERCPDVNNHVREQGFSGFQNKNNNKNNGGEIINEEFLLSEDDSSDPDADCVESSDDEVKLAREELQQLKQKQKDLAKQSKLEKIAQETKAVRKSLDKLGTRSKKSGHVTVASLRKMDDVVGQVDKLMDTNLKLNRMDRYDSDTVD